MYEAHWGLSDSPFRGLADPRYFYSSPTHDEALARLQFLVDHSQRLGLLLGSAGSGKTMTLEVFAQRLRASGLEVAVVNVLAMSSRELIWQVATQLCVNPRARDSSFELWRRLTDRLTENRYQQLKTVVLFDDAGEASDEVMACITRLVHHHSSVESPLTTVLAAAPHQLSRISPRMLQACSLRIELEPWSEEETRDFLMTSLARAGFSASDARPTVFEPGAASRLFQLSAGLPRKASHLAELSLLAGAGKRLEQVDRATVESAFEELSSVS